MVGFDQDQVAPRDCVKHVVGYVACVRQDGKLACAAAKHETDGFIRVMRSFEGEHVYAAQVKIPLRFKHAHLRRRDLADERQHAAPGAFVCVYGDVIAPRQHAHALHMVAVLVGHEQAGELLRRNACGGKRIRDRAPW